MISESMLRMCERGALALFASVWHGALLLAIVAIALRLLPRMAAATRSLIWTAALAIVVALPFLPAGSAETFRSVADPAQVHLNPAWSLAVAGVWLAMSVYRAAQLLMSGAKLRAIWASAVPVDDATEARVAWPLGMTRAAKLYTSNEVARPSVIGFFAPRILVPSELYGKLSGEEIEQIVLHEMEHLRRGDDWRNLLQKIAVMVFPLNPALLWIERRLCFERELACDESVLEQTHAPKSYAACLVHLAEERSLGRQISLALGAWERRSELGRRVKGILAHRGFTASRTMRGVYAGAVTSAMVVMAVALAQTPQLVAFGVTPAENASIEPTQATMTPRMHAADVGMGNKSQPKMVDAMMHMPSPTGTPTLNTRTKKIHVAARITRVHRMQAQQAGQPRLVLTSWVWSGERVSDGRESTVQARSPQVVYAVFRTAVIQGEDGPQVLYSETALPMESRLFILQL